MGVTRTLALFVVAAIAEIGGAWLVWQVDAVAAGTRVTFGVPWLAAPYVGVCVVALRRIERLALDGVTGCTRTGSGIS